MLQHAGNRTRRIGEGQRRSHEGSWLLRRQVKVHQDQARCCSCCCSDSHWEGDSAGCPVHLLVGPDASPPAGLGVYLQLLLPGW